MTDLCVCKKGVGFAVVTCLTAVSLTQTAPGVGVNFIDSDPACATVPGLPFTDTGDTTALDCNGDDITADVNDLCPGSFPGGTGDVEVFYRYIANAADDAADGSADGIVKMNIDACGADFDTRLLVYDDNLTVVACADDTCDTSGGDPWASQIFNAELTVGMGYWIAVDSWGPSGGVLGAGPYELRLTSGSDCILEEEDLPDCVVNESDEVPGDPSGSTPPCSTAVPGDGTADDPPTTNNNACASTGDSISCNEVFCGTSGTYDGDIDCSELGDDDCGGGVGSCDLITNTCVDPTTFRDLDFVQISLPEDVDEFNIRMTAEFAPTIFFFEPDPDCDSLSGFVVTGTAPCVTTTLPLVDVTAGDYYVVATSAFSELGAACGDAYLFEVECNLACPWDQTGGDDPDQPGGGPDGSVGFTDLTGLLGNWGACPTYPTGP